MSLLTDVTHKHCTVCKQLRPVVDFRVRVDRAGKRRGQCIPCMNKSQSSRRTTRPAIKRIKDNRVSRRARWKAKYGITEGDYARLYRQQNERCAICHQPESVLNKVGSPRLLAVDHDHVTNAVRGLLCTQCNMGIGYLRDNPVILRAAADYLERIQ